MTDRDAYEVLQVIPQAHDNVIQVAYRALAALYHPDAADRLASTQRMAELNAAYAKLRSPARRALYDEERRLGSQATTIITPVYRSGPPEAGGAGGVIDFGRYQGWSIARLAKHDPDYLRWLSRHSSGIRYRAEIESALAATTSVPTMSERLRGR